MARAGGVWCSLVLDRERRSIVKALEILLIGMAEVMENVVTSEEVEKAVNANSSPRPEKPRFEKAKARDGKGLKTQFRKVLVPAHRYTPLKSQWTEIYKPLVENLKLQVRMNLKSRCVEMKVSPHTEDPEAIQKGADFVKAFILGFEIRDSLALLRIDDLFIESFEIHDVKVLHGDHLSRAIGRLAGKDGKTKFTIENATKTRIVLADTKVHILGSYQNTRLARNAICSLILGAPPGKIYNKLKVVASRMNERF
mmetsp:Transcript_30784/g.117807  ORF Transcript_30784/g.117807 Transcript_30784/m.117807 type:complete len:254 (-) Transcript_30784:111-872(-)